MSTVNNQYGNEIDFEVAVSMMNNEYREAIHGSRDFADDQDFFNAYCAVHLREEGEEWILNTENPVY